MKHISMLRSICLCTFFALGCQQTNSPKMESGIVGQIYEVGSPAVPVDWTPPPLKGVRTIVVSNSDHVAIQTFDSDSSGGFAVRLPAGTYFLLVKDPSRPQGQNGPFAVAAGQIASVKVYHDNGMR